MSYASDRVAEIRREASQNLEKVTPAPVANQAEVKSPRRLRPLSEARRPGRALSVCVNRFVAARAQLVDALQSAGITLELLQDLNSLSGFDDVARALVSKKRSQP